ncbi:hypothetical protein [Halorussus salinisoli]|uniref:hypothetical protein n=1 Tax=Halorussus salinisoli TaxID=2558242 RepID=UPI0010C1B231|nr:hypothetical protein [Halorussus salinisoli]
MNDFDDETHAESPVSDCEATICGLLPREYARRGATLVRRPNDDPGPTKMYRAVAVHVEESSTTLLVGPQCDLSPSRTYRVVEVRGVPSGRLKTVRFRPTNASTE